MTTTQRSTAKSHPKNSHVINISSNSSTNPHASVATRCSIRKPLLLAFVLIVGIFFLYEVIMVGNFSTGNGAVTMENKVVGKHVATSEKAKKIREEGVGILKKQLEELKKVEAERKVDKDLNQIHNDEKIRTAKAAPFNDKDKMNRNGNEHMEANKKEGDVLPGEDNKALLHKLTGKHQEQGKNFVDKEEEAKIADKEEVKIADKEEEAKIAEKEEAKIVDKKDDEVMDNEEEKEHDAIDDKSKKENKAAHLNANNQHKEEVENENVEPAKENKKEILEDEKHNEQNPLRKKEQKIVEHEMQKAADGLFNEQAQHKEEIDHLAQKQDQKVVAADKFTDKKEYNAADNLVEEKEVNQKKDDKKEKAIDQEIENDHPKYLLNKGERIEAQMQKAVNKLFDEQEEHKEHIDHIAQKQDQRLEAAGQLFDKNKENQNVVQELPRTRPKHEFGNHPFFSGRLKEQRANNLNVQRVDINKPLTKKKVFRFPKEMEHPFFKGKLRAGIATKNENQKEKLF
jgi:hypothetical protein